MTANAAAAEVRGKILRKMREIESTQTRWERWESLRTYINGMAKRASEKTGGLGRK